MAKKQPDANAFVEGRTQELARRPDPLPETVRPPAGSFPRTVGTKTVTKKGTIRMDTMLGVEEAKALGIRAVEEGVTRSQLIREAVCQYLGIEPPPRTGRR